VALNFITFDKERYHQSDHMATWCQRRWGLPAGSLDRVRDEGDGGNLWYRNTIFGRTSWHFKRAEDLTLFLLVWS
jgi:hypothetical protein